MTNPNETAPTARDVLVGGLEEHACCFTPDEAQAAVDAFAHELAQVIRASRDGNTCRCGGCDSCIANWYADLIDPQAVK
jgi:aerobic-type carbon monoxide dehydrogenase small subunit (CoxS/CutS family)